MLLLWHCLLLLIILYLVPVNECYSEAPKADYFAVVVVVNVVGVALLVAIGRLKI